MSKETKNKFGTQSRSVSREVERENRVLFGLLRVVSRRLVSVRKQRTVVEIKTAFVEVLKTKQSNANMASRRAARATAQ